MTIIEISSKRLINKFFKNSDSLINISITLLDHILRFKEQTEQNNTLH